MGIFFASFKWWEQEEQAGAYDFRLMQYVQQTVCEGGMKLAVLLEAHYTPPWVFVRFPDAGQVDARNNTMQEISFSHAGAMHLLHSWHEAALASLAAGDAACIHSVQPTFNNEVETKYTQVGAPCFWAACCAASRPGLPCPPGRAGSSGRLAFVQPVCTLHRAAAALLSPTAHAPPPTCAADDGCSPGLLPTSHQAVPRVLSECAWQPPALESAVGRQL